MNLILYLYANFFAVVVDIGLSVCKMKTKSEEGEFFKVTMTLGVASYQEAEEFSEVVRIADERLYDGKQNGKNQVV